MEIALNFLLKVSPSEKCKAKIAIRLIDFTTMIVLF